MAKAGTRSRRNIKWVEQYCRVPEGKDVGKPLKLRAFQEAALAKIYDNPYGTRRAIISFGRKNAKTTLAACLLLLHLAGPEARPNSRLNSTAQSRDQAAILFSLAARMVRLSPDLSEVVTIRDTAKQLLCPRLGTLYRALSADASTAYGLSPVFIVHDELGQVKGPRSELYDALEQAVGAHENPLSIVISTQAPTDTDLLSLLIDDALAGKDPRVVLVLYAAAPEINPFSVKAIRQACPAYGDFLVAARRLLLHQGSGGFARGAACHAAAQQVAQAAVRHPEIDRGEGPGMSQPSREEVAGALSWISPDDRDVWVRMAMACRSALGNDGWALWDEWSEGSENYRPRDALAVWRSVRPAGGITAGSLFALARQNGWRPNATGQFRPRSTRPHRPPPVSAGPSREQAAEKARNLIARAKLNVHPYLARKGFPERKMLVLGEALLVPMRPIGGYRNDGYPIAACPGHPTARP